MAAMKSFMAKRRTQKKPSPAQLAARAKFVAMVRARAKQARGKKRSTRRNHAVIKIKRAVIAANPKGGQLFRVYARTRLAVPGSNHQWFLVHQDIHRSKSIALAEAKKTYRRDYDPRYLPELE